MDFQPYDKSRVSSVSPDTVVLLDTGSSLVSIEWQQLLQLIAESIAGASSFFELTDVPAAQGNGGKALRIVEGTTPTLAPYTIPFPVETLSATTEEAVKGKILYNLLAGKAAAQHGHGMSEISGLEAALEGKANKEDIGLGNVAERTGTLIHFNGRAIYNFGAPSSGAHTFNYDNLSLLDPVVVVCDGSATFPAGTFLEGSLKSGTNYVLFRAVGPTTVFGKVYNNGPVGGSGSAEVSEIEPTTFSYASQISSISLAQRVDTNSKEYALCKNELTFSAQAGQNVTASWNAARIGVQMQVTVINTEATDFKVLFLTGSNYATLDSLDAHEILVPANGRASFHLHRETGQIVVSASKHTLR